MSAVAPRVLAPRASPRARRPRATRRRKTGAPHPTDGSTTRPRARLAGVARLSPRARGVASRAARALLSCVRRRRARLLSTRARRRPRRRRWRARTTDASLEATTYAGRVAWPLSTSFSGRFDRPRAIGRVLTVSTFDRVPFQPTDEMLSRGIYRPRDVSFAGRRSTETTRDARRDAHHPRATAHEAAHEPAQDASSAAHARAVRPAADGASSARVAPPCRKRAFISFASLRFAARARPPRTRARLLASTSR